MVCFMVRDIDLRFTCSGLRVAEKSQIRDLLLALKHARTPTAYSLGSGFRVQLVM